ncbi:hypothetical protein KGQ34_01535 [Patescibacteria group bacterium]|nr:hypothetical protein [Patescibacteria group bacterium]
MHIRKIIEQLGYSSKEATVYAAALKIHDATISEVAEEAQLPRTTTKYIMKRLAEQGLLATYIKKRRAIWNAENPDVLLVRLKEREAALQEVLPQLHAMRNEKNGKPTIRFYSGTANIRRILDDIIAAKYNIRSLTSYDDMAAFLEEYFREFIEERRKHFLRVQFITNRSAETEALRKHDPDMLRQTRYLPSSFALKNGLFVYGDKIAVISLNKKMPTGITIQDQNIADTQALLFDSLWEHCEKA